MSPDNAPNEGASIRGIVTLSWPYSSSTRQCALLLADPDFRLRAKKGQVRVRFTAASAEAVAKAHIGIGDEVVLQLQGAKWAQNIQVTRTPGRSVDGELLYRNRLGLTLAKADGDVDIDINATTPPRITAQLQNVIASTPQPRNVQTLRSSFDGSLDSPPVYSSPAFTQWPRLSGNTFLGSAYNPFMEVDLDGEQPAKRQRTSFGTIGQWRYAERSPSPEKSLFDGNVTGEVVSGNDEVLEIAQDIPDGAPVDFAQASGALENAQPEDAMDIDNVVVLEQATGLISDVASLPDLLPTSVPVLQPSELHADVLVLSTPGLHVTSAEEEAAPSTPLLQAVPNSALPNPSPFASRTTPGHAPVHNDASASMEGNISTVTSPITSPQLGKQYQGRTIAEGTGDFIIDGLAPLDELEESDALQEDVSDEDETGEQAAVSVISQAAVPRGFIGNTQDTLPPMTYDHVTTVRRDKFFAAPSTPVKLPSPVFGFDGASSAKSEARVTPQSERERVMAQTFRSLFGFTKVPLVQAEAAQRSPSPTPQKEGYKNLPTDEHDTDLGSASLTGPDKQLFSQSPLLADHDASASTNGKIDADSRIVRAAATTPTVSQVQHNVPLGVNPESIQDLSQSLAAEHDARGLDGNMVAGTASSAQEVIDLLSSSDVEEQADEEEADDDNFVETYKRRRKPRQENWEAIADVSKADESDLSERDEATVHETEESSAQQGYMDATHHENDTVQSPFIPDSYEHDELDSLSDAVPDAELATQSPHPVDTLDTRFAPRNLIYDEGLPREALESTNGGETLGAANYNLSFDDSIERQRFASESPSLPLVDQVPLVDAGQLEDMSRGSAAHEDIPQPPPVTTARPAEVIDLGSSSPAPVMDKDHGARIINETADSSATNNVQSEPFDDLMAIETGTHVVQESCDAYTSSAFGGVSSERLRIAS